MLELSFSFARRFFLTAAGLPSWLLSWFLSRLPLFDCSSVLTCPYSSDYTREWVLGKRKFVYIVQRYANETTKCSPIRIVQKKCVHQSEQDIRFKDLCKWDDEMFANQNRAKEIKKDFVSMSIGAIKANSMRARIISRHLQLAIRNDEDFNKLLDGLTIAQGGVLPNIQAVLLPVNHKGFFRPTVRNGSFQSHPMRQKQKSALFFRVLFFEVNT